MKKFDARYSKILLILVGVLAAIIIGFQSNAVGFNTNSPIRSPFGLSENPIEVSGIFHFEWATFLH